MKKTLVYKLIIRSIVLLTLTSSIQGFAASDWEDEYNEGAYFTNSSYFKKAEYLRDHTPIEINMTLDGLSLGRDYDMNSTFSHFILGGSFSYYLNGMSALELEYLKKRNKNPRLDAESHFNQNITLNYLGYIFDNFYMKIGFGHFLSDENFKNKIHGISVNAGLGFRWRYKRMVIGLNAFEFRRDLLSFDRNFKEMNEHNQLKNQFRIANIKLGVSL